MTVIIYDDDDNDDSDGDDEDDKVEGDNGDVGQPPSSLSLGNIRSARTHIGNMHTYICMS